ncbi:hypothetical protein AAHC03_024427 [Spirometra sp. Aus1]
MRTRPAHGLRRNQRKTRSVAKVSWAAWYTLIECLRQKAKANGINKSHSVSVRLVKRHKSCDRERQGQPSPHEVGAAVSCACTAATSFSLCHSGHTPYVHVARTTWPLALHWRYLALTQEASWNSRKTE